MKYRSQRQLGRMLTWTHRRLHQSDDRNFPYWLAVRTRIQNLIIQGRQPWTTH